MEAIYEKIIYTLVALLVLVFVRQIVIKNVVKRFILAKFSPARKK